MASSLRSVTFDCADPRKLAEFWSGVLNYKIEGVDEDGSVVVNPGGQEPRLLFIPVPEGKTVKNRVHFDLIPENTMVAEVERLLQIGATVITRPNGADISWTVMSDPEGNEFCVERGPGDKTAG